LLAGLFLADPSTLTDIIPRFILPRDDAIKPLQQKAESSLYLTKSERSILFERLSSIYEFSVESKSLASQTYLLQRSRPRQQQITKPLPIRTVALLGTPSKTVLSGTPELVRGLRQFYLAADSG
jgi:hypothetical protein